MYSIRPFHFSTIKFHRHELNVRVDLVFYGLPMHHTYDIFVFALWSLFTIFHSTPRPPTRLSRIQYPNLLFNYSFGSKIPDEVSIESLISTYLFLAALMECTTSSYLILSIEIQFSIFDLPCFSFIYTYSIVQ